MKMGDFSDFRRGQTVGLLLAGAYVTKTATLLGVSRAAVCKVMMTYTNHGKTSAKTETKGNGPPYIEKDWV
jgi:hypothetical protein